MEICMPPDAPRKGWECPKCGRVYAPIVQVCQPCNDAVAARLKPGYKRVVEIR